MYSEQLMKYLLTYQRENNSNYKNNDKNKTLKIKKNVAEGQYATVPIRYTK